MTGLRSGLTGETAVAGCLLVVPDRTTLVPKIQLINPLDTCIGPFTFIGPTFLWISALVTLYTGYDYFRAGIRHIISEEM